MKVDFHFHSHYSDGDLSPPELLQIAHEHQIERMSLTDHDTVDAYPAFSEAANELGIKVFCGLECSVTWFAQELHIVALGVDAQHERLQAYLEIQKEKRIIRAKKIAYQLEQIGFKDCYEQVLQLAGHTNISRTHFAKLLVEKYHIRDHRAAFKMYLGQNGVAYVPSQWVNMSETIAVIQASGGIAVLAHPLHYPLTSAQLKGLIKAFKEAHGEGIEVISGWQTPKDTKRMTQLCRDFKCWASTGSDFHRYTPYRATLGNQSPLPDCLKPIWLHDAFQ